MDDADEYTQTKLIQPNSIEMKLDSWMKKALDPEWAN